MSFSDVTSKSGGSRKVLGCILLAVSGARLVRRAQRVLLGFCVALTSFSIPARASLDPDKPIKQNIHQGWQMQQGLPQNSVLAIAQTPDGYLWLGTEEGMARFDGVRFTTLDKHTSGIQTNQIQALLSDHNGDLWIGTNGGGLSRFSHGKFTSYTSRSGLTNNSIRALYEDNNKTLWIGTDGGGLIRLEHGELHVFTKADGLADNAVFAISGDRNGTLWIGTQAGLSKFSNGTFQTFGAKEGLTNEYVRTLAVSRQGPVWVGTSDGLYRVTSAGISRFTTSDGLSKNMIYSLYEDRVGTLWIGTGGGGLSRFVNGRFDSYTDKDGLVGRDVAAILEDREGSLWVGTAGGGLTCLKKGSFATLSKQDGLISDTILPVYQDSEGAVWMGSDQGLMRLKDNRITSYSTSQGLPDNFVFSITQDHEGSMWIGTRRGLARLNGGKIVTFTAREGLGSDWVMCTYTDRAGNVWIGTHGGLSRFDGRGFTTYTTRDGLSNNYVLSLYQDKDANLWIGTNGGLTRFKDGQFRSYSTRDGLSSDVIYSIYGDPDGTLWLATNGGGLNRFRNGKFTTYTSSKGMYDDAVFQILDDGLGHLWVTSNKGVFELSKKQLNDFAEGRVENITPVVYGTADGMKSRECNGGFQPAGWRTKDGRLYFPTGGGLAIVNPYALVKNGVPPQPILERVSVNNKDVPLDKPVVVPPGKGQLEFQFTAPSFIAPGKIQFRYMLEGFDKDWTQAGGRRTAYYTNIPHGEYRFRVVAGNDEAWSKNEAAVALTLQPHLYETKTFLFLIGLAILSLCGGAYRFRVSQLKLSEQKLLKLVDERTSALQESERQVRRSRDELELRVQERTSELLLANQALEEEVDVRRRTEEQLILAKEAAEAASRAKSDFLANMSHEIRTPINGILGMADVALSTNLDEEQREYLDIVKFSADSLLGIVNDILDFSKIEARKLTLDRTSFRLRKSVDELVRSLLLRARQKHLFLTSEVLAQVPDELIGDPLRLRQVLLNLLDNALKFTSSGGVSLSVAKEQDSEGGALLHFSVRDTGIGIPPGKQKTIFEAFSQADTSSTRRYGGTGLGLTISYQLAAMMGGRLWVESDLGSGSTFHFTARLEVATVPQVPGSSGGVPAVVLA